MTLTIEAEVRRDDEGPVKHEDISILDDDGELLIIIPSLKGAILVSPHEMAKALRTFVLDKEGML